MATTRLAKIIIVLWIITPVYIGDLSKTPNPSSISGGGIIGLIIGIIAYRSINKLRRECQAALNNDYGNETKI